MGVTRTLARFVAEAKYEDLPPKVVNHAKMAVLNILAAALGGYKTKIGERHIQLAKNTSGAISESTIIGEGTKVSCPFAAYANGNLAFALDYEDVVLYTLHAGPIVVPAALATAEKKGASGIDFLNAVVLGYEIGTRIGISMQPTAERGSKVWGQQYTPFAACIASGKLLGLSEEQMDAAFGITGTYSTVPSAYKYFGMVNETRPMREVKLGWGWMSMIGVFSALSADIGFGGGYGVLDGDEGFWIMAGSDRCEFEKMTAGLGSEYVIMETDFKVHPSIAWNHPPHTALKQLVEEYDIKPDDIRHVRLKGIGADRIDDYNPSGPVDAMFSLPYTVATTIMREPLLPDLYSDAKLHDPTVQALLKKIKVEPDAEADRIWFEEQRMKYSLEVLLQDGRQLNTQAEYPKDKPNITGKDIEKKFRDLGSLSLSKERVEQVIETVDRLDTLSDISELTKLF